MTVLFLFLLGYTCATPLPLIVAADKSRLFNVAWDNGGTRQFLVWARSSDSSNSADTFAALQWTSGESSFGKLHSIGSQWVWYDDPKTFQFASDLTGARWLFFVGNGSSYSCNLDSGCTKLFALADRLLHIDSSKGRALLVSYDSSTRETVCSSANFDGSDAFKVADLGTQWTGFYDQAPGMAGAKIDGLLSERTVIGVSLADGVDSISFGAQSDAWFEYSHALVIDGKQQLCGTEDDRRTVFCYTLESPTTATNVCKLPAPGMSLAYPPADPRFLAVTSDLETTPWQVYKCDLFAKGAAAVVAVAAGVGTVPSQQPPVSVNGTTSMFILSALTANNTGFAYLYRFDADVSKTDSGLVSSVNHPGTASDPFFIGASGYPEPVVGNIFLWGINWRQSASTSVSLYAYNAEKGQPVVAFEASGFAYYLAWTAVPGANELVGALQGPQSNQIVAVQLSWPPVSRTLASLAVYPYIGQVFPGGLLVGDSGNDNGANLFTVDSKSKLTVIQNVSRARVHYAPEYDEITKQYLWRTVGDKAPDNITTFQSPWTSADTALRLSAQDLYAYSPSFVSGCLVWAAIGQTNWSIGFVSLTAKTKGVSPCNP